MNPHHATTYSIEEYDPATLEDVRAVFVTAWRHLAENILSLDYGKVDPAKWGLNPTVVARTKDGRIIGFAQVRGNWLQRLYVLPDHHGTGVAQLLLSSAEAAGAWRLTVDEGNEPARKFYEKSGWRFTGERNPGHTFPEKIVLTYAKLAGEPLLA